jgi:hypothetical protein
MRPNFTNAGEVNNLLAAARANFEIRQSRLALDARTSMQTLRRQTLIRILIENRARPSTVARCSRVVLTRRLWTG